MIDLGGNTILITGGTGSFGHEITNYLITKNPKQIRIFSRDENKQYEMKKQYPDLDYIIGDIRDDSKVDFATRNTDIIIHACALKQVPSCEDNPFEAVKTNIIGSQILCNSAIRNDVKKVIALSTDKSVEPINAMGISKAMMEKIICSQNRFQKDTKFCCVRYGNVLGSRGSVVPLFLNQINQKMPLTITNPSMTRFMMTLGQAVKLVEKAVEDTKGGEIFVQKAPACKIVDLAKVILKKFSDGDLDKIKIVGQRPGEKIHEILVNKHESLRSIEEKTTFSIFPHYFDEKFINIRPSEFEYNSLQTEQLSGYEDISGLLNKMGHIKYLI